MSQIEDLQLSSEGAEQLFGHCFELATIKEGSLLPVGGNSIFSPEVNNIEVRIDLRAFNDFFLQIHQIADGYNAAKLREWLDSQGLDIDEHLFAELFAFTQQLEEHYPDSPEKSQIRNKLYYESIEAPLLSDVFKLKAQECAEITALAQGFLQQEKVSSHYFSGDVTWRRDQEFSDSHSFIVIYHEEKVYLYDPANPLDTNLGKCPSIYVTQADFSEEVRKRQKRFVSSRNLLNGSLAFFGVNIGAGSNVRGETDIV